MNPGHPLSPATSSGPLEPTSGDGGDTDDALNPSTGLGVGFRAESFRNRPNELAEEILKCMIGKTENMSLLCSFFSFSYFFLLP